MLVFGRGCDPSPLGFGLFIRAAGKSLQQLYDEFQMAEDLGFDHATISDHAKDTDGPPTDAMHKASTRMLTAVAARTSRIPSRAARLERHAFRHPALLLRQAVTVDHVSEGRLTLGIGTGWFEDEHRRFGIGTSRRPESGSTAWRRPSS